MKEIDNKINVIVRKVCFSHRISTSIKGVISNIGVLVAKFVVFFHAVGNK